MAAGEGIQPPHVLPWPSPSKRAPLHSVNQPVLKRVSVDNLKRTLDRATSFDIEAGLASFRRYHRIVSLIAARTGHTPRIGAAVFAALSPNNDYHGNLRDAHALLAAASRGDPLDSFGVSTYGPNKRKAWAIAHGEDPLALIVAKKTRSFFLNIDNPDDPVPVTIDGHMYNIWRCQRENLVGLRWRVKNYDQIADDVRVLAQECKMVPCQMQGVLWITWRRIHRIKTSDQLTFWDEDLAAARLGLHRSLPSESPDLKTHGSSHHSNGSLHPSPPNGKSLTVFPAATARASTGPNSPG